MPKMENPSYLYNFKSVQEIFEKYPFMKEHYTCVDCNPDNGWKFIEYKNMFDKKINDEYLSEDSRKEGFRLLKVKILENDPSKIVQKEGFSYGYNKFNDDETFTLEMKDDEIQQGFRYLKVKFTVPKNKSWLTLSEIEDGWKVPKKTFRVGRNTQTRRKKKKFVKKEPEPEDNEQEKSDNQEATFQVTSL